VRFKNDQRYPLPNTLGARTLKPTGLKIQARQAPRHPATALKDPAKTADSYNIPWPALGMSVMDRRT